MDGGRHEELQGLEVERSSTRLRLWMTAALSCAVAERSAVYVSTPITTGHRFVAWRRGLRAGLRAGDAEYSLGLQAEVIAPNRAQIAPLVGRLRSSNDSPVIDPTVLEDVPGWEQFDYHDFWAGVIQQYAHTAVFADGWQYSSGCVLELAAAAEAGATLLRQDLTALAPQEAISLVETAIADIAADQVLPQEPLQRALAALRALMPTRGTAEGALQPRE